MNRFYLTNLGLDGGSVVPSPSWVFNLVSLLYCVDESSSFVLLVLLHGWGGSVDLSYQQAFAFAR